METQLFLRSLYTLMDSRIPFTDIILSSDEVPHIKTPSGWLRITEILKAEDDPLMTEIMSTPVPRHCLESMLSEMDSEWEQRILEKRALNRPVVLMQSTMSDNIICSTDYLQMMIGKTHETSSVHRLRAAAYLSFSGAKLNINIRRLPISPPSLRDLGLPDSVGLLSKCNSGLILISGPTGSGKSTTMSAIINVINQSRRAHILTIEDPIEYIHAPIRSVVTQLEVDIDTACFTQGVYDAMRERPDVIAIGEIRDKRTAEAAINASESGALIIGTIHGNNVPTSIQKLLSFFDKNDYIVKESTLKSTLVGAISQKLVENQQSDDFELAYEVLINHKRQHSKHITDADVLKREIEESTDNLSFSFRHSFNKLVESGKISKTVASGQYGIQLNAPRKQA